MGRIKKKKTRHIKGKKIKQALRGLPILLNTTYEIKIIRVILFHKIYL